MHVRIQSIDELPVFSLVLDQSKLQCTHYVDEALKEGAFLRFCYCAIDLREGGGVQRTGFRSVLGDKLTGRKGGEIIRLIKGANSSCKISLHRRCRSPGDLCPDDDCTHLASDL